MSELLEKRMMLTSSVVNSTGDDTLAGDGLTTLREAIIAANADTTADTITFNLPSGAQSINLNSQLPNLRTDMSIQGPGSGLLTVRRNTNASYRDFNITAGHTISLSGMTIMNGTAGGDSGGNILNTGSVVSISGCVISNGTAAFGAGISNTGGGTLTLSNTQFSANVASSDGGAIDNFGDGTSVTLTDCTLSTNRASRFAGGINNNGGTLSVTHCTFVDNSGDRGGGAIENAIGSATVTTSSFTNNKAPGVNNPSTAEGGAIANSVNCTLGVSNSTFSGSVAAYRGGAVSNLGSATFSGCTLSNSTATNNSGGGFYNSGTLTLTNTTVSGSNALNGSGGGIANVDGTVNLTNSTINNNTAGSGGGINSSYSGSGSNFPTLNITRSTVSNNAANYGIGGGIVNDYSSTLNLTNSTIANNIGGVGGGIYNVGTLNAESSTIARNNIYYYAGGIYNYGTVTLHNSIVALNNYYDIYNFGTIDNSDHNWVGDWQGDARLGVLANNGGPTQTISLLPDSPCLDAGPVTSTLSTDQRGAGFPRITGAAQDLGAFELQHIVVDNTGDLSDGDYSALHLTLREAIQIANTTPAAEIIDFDPGVFSTPQTINLASALPNLSSDLLVKGPGTDKLNIHRDSTNSFRIFTVDSAKTVQLSGMTLTNGKASGPGGAIRNAGTLTLDHLALKDNSAAGNGGAIYNDAGALNISYSTLSHNDAFAGNGGAIYNNQNGSVNIDRSTLDHNHAIASGGGIYNNNGYVYVRTSTFNANTTDHNGGAAANIQGSLDLAGCTIAGNSATVGGGGIYTANNGGTYLNSNIIAQNTAPTGANTAGDFTYDNGFNFIGGDPKLGPLADNGGPTQTMALGSDSPCINAGNSGLYSNTDFDQRGPGHSRFGGFLVDIGAYEYDGFHESLVVTNTSDEDNGTSDPSFGNGTSLREALEWADHHDGPDIITFDLGAGAQTINLTGSLNLNGGITLQGPGADLLDIHRDTGGDYSVMYIAGDSTLSGLTISNGSAYYGGIYASGGNINLNQCVLRDNNASYGGGIYNYNSHLTLTACSLVNNTAGQGGGIYNDYNGTVDATLTSFINNTADFGGGIRNYSGALNFDHCTFSQNGAGNNGGAIQNDYGNISLYATTLDNNSAAYQGAGIWTYNGYTTVVDSTISNNEAAKEGGGIYSFYANVLVRQSTIANNRAFNRIGGTGGGITNFSGALNIDFSTVAGNSAYKGGGVYSQTSFAANNSIIAQNTAPGSNPNTFGDMSGAYNYIGGDPKLAALADNGGPTQTMALLPGSPCIDAGDPNVDSPPDYDQRGNVFKRIRNGLLDIGSFEYSVPTTSNLTASVDEDQTLAFSAGFFDAGFSDPDGKPLTQVKILSLPTQGSLVLGNSSVSANQVIDRADLATLAYLPGSNYNGLDGFEWTATNGNAYAAGSAALSITVNAVNDGPGGSAAPVSVSEDGSVNVILNATDVETPLAQLKFTILSLPTRGTLKYNGNVVTAGQAIVGSPTSLVYECGAIAEGAGTDSFTFNVTDGGDGSAAPRTSATATANINITKAVEDRQVVLGAGGIVRIGGTASGDHLLVTTGNGKLRVSIGSVVISSSIPLTSITEVRVWSRGGNDNVEIDGLSSSIKTYIHGGAGNDSLQDGSGAGVLIGGDGNDIEHGGRGNDLLIGCAGSDQLYGDEDNDVLIAGLPSLKLTLGAIRNISNAWNSTKASQSALLGTVTDTETDSLTGGSSADWFVRSSADKLYDVNVFQKDLTS